jgi:import inner membrane translocase subunit TIM44
MCSAKGTGKIAKAVGSAVDATLETPIVKSTFKAVGDVSEAVSHTAGKIAEPVLDTRAAKAVGSGLKSVKRDMVDSVTSHRYIEYQPKEAREKARAEKMDPEVRRIMIANPDAGDSVVLHSDEKLKGSWSKFKENSSIFKGLAGFLIFRNAEC